MTMEFRASTLLLHIGRYFDPKVDDSARYLQTPGLSCLDKPMYELEQEQAIPEVVRKVFSLV